MENTINAMEDFAKEFAEDQETFKGGVYAPNGDPLHINDGVPNPPQAPIENTQAASKAQEEQRVDLSNRAVRRMAPSYVVMVNTNSGTKGKFGIASFKPADKGAEHVDVQDMYDGLSKNAHGMFAMTKALGVEVKKFDSDATSTKLVTIYAPMEQTIRAWACIKALRDNTAPISDKVREMLDRDQPGYVKNIEQFYTALTVAQKFGVFVSIKPYSDLFYNKLDQMENAERFHGKVANFANGEAFTKDGTKITADYKINGERKLEIRSTYDGKVLVALKDGMKCSAELRMARGAFYKLEELMPTELSDFEKLALAREKQGGTVSEAMMA